uniref:Uncharacterized protein, isoform B n=1 Tax=Drosophila melanogaster TaxID=7227 RepID=A0A0B4JDC5_DROME|nr:uncharacterized protein Dmel_CG31493, isoform B [Drosophila melanogaster]ADV37281.1 uncharacterized protein Dmel_CG31493, isoform B [Drosophila melanogaster]|eukprot:NP_001189190.1 uncharacterized protein Dmel_CG31493, isoform B [Drosophila melanogaster]
MKDCVEIFEGEFEVLRVTPPLYDEVEELLVNISINYEFGCVIAKLKDSPLAIAELVHPNQNTKRKTSYYDICAQIKSPNMIKYMELWDAVDASFNVNEHCQVDSTGDVEYMATLPEFRRRGLGHILCQQSIQFASLLAQRKLPLEILNQLPEEMRIERPQAIVAITTSQSSQIMGRQLGMKTMHKWHFSELRSLCGAMAESNGAAQAFEYAELQVVKF